MHVTLHSVLELVNLASLIIGFGIVANTINNYRRQMNAQVLLKYTERYERILEQFPENARDARFDTTVLPPQSSQLTLCVLKYMNLCSEEYYLKQHGYLSESVWHIWEGDLKRMIASPLVQREWQPRLRQEFLFHQEFLQYVERIQAESKSAIASHA
jgi:hypothetical protein